MNDFNELNNETFGEGGNIPPETPQTKQYVTYIPYGFTPKTYEERNKIKKVGNVVGLSLLALNLLAVVISFCLTLVLSKMGITSEKIHNIVNDDGFNQFFQTTVSTLLFILPFTAIFKFAGYRISDLVIFEKPKEKTFLPFFLFGISFCAFSNIAVSIAGEIFERAGINYEVDFGDNPKGIFGFLLSFIAISVVPALVEEFACRGLILGSLRKFGDGFAIFASSIVFGVMHGNFQQMPFAFLVGLILGYVTVKTGTLWISVAIHAFNNFISLVFDYLPKSIPMDIKNAAYIIFLTVLMILGLLSIILLNKNKENLEIEKSETEATERQKYKWFFSSAAIVIFLIVSVIEALSFFSS